MRASERRALARLLARSAASLLAGIGLCFLARWLEQGWGERLLPPVLLEEGLKAVLFLGLLAARRVGPRRLAGAPAADLLPLLAVTGFALTENLLFFLASPTRSIYQRLLYAYPVHVNTGLLYTLALLSGRPGLLLAALAPASAYHLGLNALALSAPAAWTWTAGAANLPLLGWLILRLRRRRVERSLETCWKTA